MASVTKLFTVFVGLLELTEKQWDLSLADVIPGFAKVSSNNSREQDAVYNTPWDEVTVRALSAQEGGVSPGFNPQFDLLYQYGVTAILENSSATTLAARDGFPPLPFSVLGPCASYETLACSAADYVKGVRNQPPALLPWTSPGYANSGFTLLGMAISNITGKTYETLYHEDVFEPLGMLSSFSAAPTGEEDLERAVIAGPPETSGFWYPDDLPTPSGGLLSTTNDLAKFGINLLNSTLLTPAQTRRWMKPVSFTSSYSYAVGAPWEIIRYVNPTTGKITDLYTKLGDAGFYGGIMVAIPDYDAGFTILNAYSNESLRSAATQVILDYIGEAVVPALEAQAAVEARRNLVGTYVSEDSDLDSSLTVAFNQSTVPGAMDGINIDSWISNGTDMIASYFSGVKPRLYPSIPKQSEGKGQLAFQASPYLQTSTYTEAGMGPFTGFYGSNLDWLGSGGENYGGVSVNLFVFDVDAQGFAKAVTTAGTRATLKKRQNVGRYVMEGIRSS